jgi:hypothetical protein
MNFGIVVEGSDDAAVYRILIKRIDNNIDHVHSRECFGRVKLRNKFVYFLKEFTKNPAAFDLRKVLVIRDSDCSDPGPIEQELRGIFGDSGVRPNFAVDFHATKCKLESWLLGDADAISAVAIGRGGIGGVRRIGADLEDLREADQLYRRTIYQAGLQDTDAVMKEIAQQARLETIVERCPRFRDFMRKVVAR